MSGLLVNPVFIARFYKDYGGADGTTAGIDTTIIGISVACLQLTAALGALIAGRLGDIIGRKKCVRIGGAIYFVTAFMQMFAPGFGVFVAGRTLQGLGVGFLSMTVPIIQTEIAAAHRRGLMVGIEYTCLIAGYMLSCWVDYGFNFTLPSNMSWQGPFIIQIVLSFVLTAMSFFLPETPRWLAKNGFMTECLQTLADLHSDGDTQAEHVQQVFVEIQEAVIYETKLGSCGWGVGPSICILYAFHADLLTRKCSQRTVSARLSASRFKCLRNSTASISSPSISQVHSRRLGLMTANRSCTRERTPSRTLPRQSPHGI